MQVAKIVFAVFLALALGINISFLFLNGREYYKLEFEQAKLWLDHLRNFFWFFLHGGLDL